MADMPLTGDKLAGIKPGYRVRVTMEGRIHDMDKYGVEFVMDSVGVNMLTLPSDVILASTFQIERIEPPLKVGDRVHTRMGDGVIEAMCAGYAWIRFGQDKPHAMQTMQLKNLERVA